MINDIKYILDRLIYHIDDYKVRIEPRLMSRDVIFQHDNLEYTIQVYKGDKIIILMCVDDIYIGESDPIEMTNSNDSFQITSRVDKLQKAISDFIFNKINNLTKIL